MLGERREIEANQVKSGCKRSPIGPRWTIQGKNLRTKKMHQNAAERGNHSHAARGDCHGLTVAEATAVVVVVYPGCFVFLRTLLFSCAIFRFFAANQPLKEDVFG